MRKADLVAKNKLENTRVEKLVLEKVRNEKFLLK